MTPLFILYKRQYKPSGIIISRYKPHPSVDLYIDAINVKTGQVAKKRIVEYSYHENLDMYKISCPNNELFKPFWVSSDHSLIVYDYLEKQLRKLSPIEVLKEPSRYALVRKKQETYETINIVEHNIKIEYDPSITVAADLTVEDYFTFATADNIFVQDTMAVYAVLTKEAQQEAETKMMSQYASCGFNKQTLKLINDVITGIYQLTK